MGHIIWVKIEGTKRRVQFDPLALLLDASLEGEIELVKRVIDKVFLVTIRTKKTVHNMIPTNFVIPF